MNPKKVLIATQNAEILLYHFKTLSGEDLQKTFEEPTLTRWAIAIKKFAETCDDAVLELA